MHDGWHGKVHGGTWSRRSMTRNDRMVARRESGKVLCFTECPRYQSTRRVPAAEDADYAKCEVRGFREWMMPAGESITIATVPRATRQYGY